MTVVALSATSRSTGPLNFQRLASRTMRALFSPDGLMGKLFFRAVRGFVRVFLFRWFRLRVEGRERLQLAGGVIIAPTHRSNLDGPLIGSSSHRRVRYLGKDSLFQPAAAGWAMRSLGSFPVRRGEADLDAMRVAKEMLEAGECMLVFPEGTRQVGDAIGEIYDGTAWLASKANTRGARGYRWHRSSDANRIKVSVTGSGRGRSRRDLGTAGGN